MPGSVLPSVMAPEAAAPRQARTQDPPPRFPSPCLDARDGRLVYAPSYIALACVRSVLPAWVSTKLMLVSGVLRVICDATIYVGRGQGETHVSIGPCPNAYSAESQQARYQRRSCWTALARSHSVT